MPSARKIFALVVFLSFGLCASVTDLYAATITAVSASYTDVKAAVTAAASGDTVIVPAGSATWSSQLNISRGLILQGAGIGKTVITSGINDAYNTRLISYSPASPGLNETFELAGFTFNGSYTSGILSISSNSSTTAISNIKVHDNRFINAKSRAISLYGLEFGVFCKNQFEDNYIAISGIGSEMNGWNYPLTQGGANYPYFEDNTFNQTVARGGFIVETGRGGRIAFRHNTITNYGGAGGEVFDAHGVNGVYPTDTGTVSVEYYNNSIGLSSSARVFNHRGGKAMYFNNTVTGAGGYMTMTEYQGWSYCSSAGYPKPEQINNSYYWNNNETSSLCCSSSNCGCGGGQKCSPAQYDDMYIQANRDYWLPASGLDANKPATCTANTFYGTTDTGKLYKCNSANTWALQYTPYQYPHPLRGGTTTHVVPNAPANLRVQ